ncbi:MAG: DPP IV N-terminal domain-containing protein, partial [Hyphomonas sp.]
MMPRILLAALLAAFALTACTTPAPLPGAALPETSSMTQTSRLTPERLYASPSLSGTTPRGVKFSPDGTRVTYLKPRADDLARFDLWQFDVATGAETMLADSALLDPEGAELSEEEKALRERRRIAGVRGIADYAWGTADSILIPAGGALFLVSLADGAAQVRQLTETESFEYDAKVSPKGRYVSFIRDEALHVIELSTGTETRVSPPARPDDAVRYGVAEFVAQEEMDRFTGYWWSPDERYIAYTEVDESGVDIIPRFDIAADTVTVINQRYPRAGRPNARVALHVFDWQNGASRKIASVGPDDYLARVNWAHGSLWFQTVNRDQTEIRFNRTDGLPWRIWAPFTEAQPRWVNLSNDFLPLADGSLLTTHETDGYRHIYRRNPSNDMAQQLTSGDWVVSELLGFEATSETIYFTGFLDTPLERHLYAAALSGNSPRRISPEGGNWSISLAPDAQSYVGTFSSPNQPPQVGLYRIDGTRIAWISENALNESHPYTPYLASHAVPEFGIL